MGQWHKQDLSSNLSGGCDPEVSVAYTSFDGLDYVFDEGLIPQLVNGGGSITVYWDITDLCLTQTVSATYTIDPPTTLAGQVSYYIHEGSNQPLDNFSVKLIGGPDKSVLATTVTDPGGFFAFDDDTTPTDLSETEFIEVTSNLPHGGMSAIDALAIQRRVANLPVPYWEPEDFLTHVGDVGADGLNTTDAARVQFRSIFPGTQFDAGEWAFYSPADMVIFDNVHVDGEPSFTARRPYYPTTCVIDITARTYGDVRGSYDFGKVHTTFRESSIHSDQVTWVKSGESFTLPVTVDRSFECGAMQLEIPYNAHKIEVLDIVSVNGGLINHTERGLIEVSWFDLVPITLKEGDAILYLELRTIDHVSETDEIFYKGVKTEFGDARASLIDGVGLKINRITDGTVTNIPDIPEGRLELNVFPNPFTDRLNVEYTLDRPANVRVTIINTMGSIVSELMNTEQHAGFHSHVFLPENNHYRQGIYLLRIEVNKGNQVLTETRRLLFER